MNEKQKLRVKYLSIKSVQQNYALRQYITYARSLWCANNIIEEEDTIFFNIFINYVLLVNTKRSDYS